MVTATEIVKIGELALTLRQFGEQEQQIILHFQERMSSIYLHRKYVAQLLAQSKALRSHDEPGARLELQRLSKRIKGEVLTKFGDVIQYEQEEETLLGQEAAVVDAEKSVLQKELGMLATGDVIGDAARKKVKAAIKTLQKALEHEGTAGTIISELKEILKNLRTIIKTQKDLLALEMQALEVFEKAPQLDVEGARQLRDAEELLEGVVYSLEQSIRREKNECLGPLNKYLKKKMSIATTVHDLVKSQPRITIKDIKKDLRQFTKPEEITEYMRELFEHAHLLDAEARRKLPEFVRHSEKLRKIEAQQVIIDPRTGVLSQKHFVENIVRIVGEEVQKNHPLSIIMFDIDHFKPFNDTFGHALGDQVLAWIGKLLRNNIKGSDLVFRYGGEEFIIVQKNTYSEEAYDVAERCREAVQNLSGRTLRSWAVENPELLEKGLGEKTITISGGVACMQLGTPPDKEMISPKEYPLIASILVGIADALLYQAKQKGRNRIENIPGALSYNQFMEHRDKAIALKE